MPIYEAGSDKPADINTKKPLDMQKTDFLGLLAHSANLSKESIVMAMLKLIKEGDPAALKMLEKAFADLKPQDIKNRPIPILMGVTQKRHVSSNDSPPSDSSAN